MSLLEPLAGQERQQRRRAVRVQEQQRQQQAGRQQHRQPRDHLELAASAPLSRLFAVDPLIVEAPLHALC
jgi:hypothetical protein